jgi:hypothetical protein
VTGFLAELGLPENPVLSLNLSEIQLPVLTLFSLSV